MNLQCDENRPVRVNCVTADYRCSFLEQLQRSDKRTTTPSIPPSPGTPDITPDQQYQLNLDHLELFGHFHDEVYGQLAEGSLTNYMMFALVRNHVRSAPYLVHQVLAVSALHLSIVRPENRRFYHKYADGLHLEALRLFNLNTPKLDQVNSVPMFLYSSHLGIYMLCTTLIYRNEDADEFLDSFNQYLKLHRGVKAITAGTWQYLKTSELAEFLASAVNSTASSTAGNECSTLSGLIDESTVSVVEREVYSSTIEILESLFNVARESPGNLTSALCSWPILTPAEYSNLLAQRRPQALIILAYYGVLLHQQRGLWIVGDRGKFLIHSITRVLGHKWSGWLSWPVSQVQNS